MVSNWYIINSITWAGGWFYDRFILSIKARDSLLIDLDYEEVNDTDFVRSLINENISEIALEVGFTNPDNFAKAFRTHFGVSPTEFRNKNED